jgi:Flp pilus assembly protein TadG
MSLHSLHVSRQFTRDERGQVAIMFGLFTLPLFMLGAGAIEYGMAFSLKNKVQAAADIATLSAASMPSGTPAGAREAKASAVFSANLTGIPGLTAVPSANGSTVSLTVSGSHPTAILKLVHIDSINIGATSSSTASYSDQSTTTTTTVDAGKVCLLALDPAASNGFISQGTPNVNYENCWAHTNSTSLEAIAGGGSAVVVGAGHHAVGGVTESAKGVYSPEPTGGAAVVNDPFATVGAYVTPYSYYTPKFTPPSIDDTCKASNLKLKKGTFTLDPGRYCGGIEIQAQAKVTFNAGKYIITNGQFLVQSGASVTGSDILFYFASNATTMTIIGGGTINLKGRTSGNDSRKGFLFIAHPDAGRGLTSNIQGGGSFTMEGMLYMPTQNIIVTGNGDSNLSSNMFAMVAKSFEFRGNGIFRFKPWNAASNMPDLLPSWTSSTEISTTTQTLDKVKLN